VETQNNMDIIEKRSMRVNEDDEKKKRN